MRCPTLSELPPSPPGKTGWPWTEESPQLPELMPDGSEWPCISIVTPNYNYEHFIEETIRSVLLQGYPNLEYILIDGASTDNSIENIQKYQHFFTYFKSEKDGGQSDAINKGFTVSNGAIMGWINSDDLLAKDALYKLAIHYRAGLKWWTGSGIQILKDGTFHHHNLDWESTISTSKILHARSILFQPSTFWNRELWNKSGSSIEPLGLAMDYDLWLRFSKHSPAVVIRDYLGIFRTHDTAKTGTEDGFSSYLQECDRVRLNEYKNSNRSQFARTLLIWFWTRFTLSKRYGWRSWVGKRQIPYI